MSLSELYSSFISFISLTFLLNGIPLTFSILIILLKLLIQSNCHLLSKGTPHQNQQSLMTKTRQSECLKRFWIHNIQNQAVAFNIRFTELTVTLILSDITQMMINFKTYQKFYRNITCNILINQIHSLLNWNWFIISQQRQAERKSRTQSQRLFQVHYSFLTEFNFQEHSFWASRTKLTLKMGGNIGSSSSSKQHLFC